MASWLHIPTSHKNSLGIYYLRESLLAPLKIAHVISFLCDCGQSKSRLDLDSTYTTTSILYSQAIIQFHDYVMRAVLNSKVLCIIPITRT